MGQFQVGKEKTGGRKKGTPNNKTIDLISILRKSNFCPIEHLQQILPLLKVEKQADVLLELMQYIFPKRKAVDLNCSDSNINTQNKIEAFSSRDILTALSKDPFLEKD